MPKYKCPCCGYYTFVSKSLGVYDIRKMSYRGWTVKVPPMPRKFKQIKTNSKNFFK